ncbi:MAG TPA: serine protease [Verrucomicrobiae bacterium]|nr:serine protease [Verrucomicrobiae bacterium]
MQRILTLGLVLCCLVTCAAERKGEIPEVRAGTNTYRKVIIQERVGNKLVIAHSLGLSSIDITSLDEATRVRLGVAGPLLPTERITGLILTNQGGSGIAKGHSLFLNQSNSTCRLAFQGHALIFRFEHADGNVELCFNGPDNLFVHPGTYENAQSRSTGPNPRLEISADGTSHAGTGKFEVKEVTYFGEKVGVFRATFEFKPDNSLGQVTGELYYNVKAFYPSGVIAGSKPAAQTGERYTALVVNQGGRSDRNIFCVAPEAMAKASKEYGGGYRFSFVTAQGTRDVYFLPPPNDALHLGKFSGARSVGASGLSARFGLSLDSGMPSRTYGFEIKHLQEDELGNVIAFHAAFWQEDQSGCQGEVCFNSPQMYSTNEFREVAKHFSKALETSVPGKTSKPRRSGTGFFISDDGFLITNDHVVNNASDVQVVTSVGTFRAKLVQSDAGIDLALLKAEGKFCGLPIAGSRAVRLGGTVATIGFPNPLLQGFAPKLAKGEIAALSGAADNPRHFQISVPVQPGNSGGALVDERGNVVGVVSAKLDASLALAASGVLPENVNYAVKSSYLLSFLEAVPAVSPKLKRTLVADRKFEDVVKAAQDAAVMVLVY